MGILKNNYYQLVEDNGSYFTRSITTDGTDAGSFEMNVDGSITPVEFFIAPEPNQTLWVEEVVLVITDTGTTTWDNYGSVAGPLVNGVQFFIEAGGVKEYLNVNLKRNIDIVRHSSSFDIITMTSHRIITYRDSFVANTEGIELRSSLGMKFGAEIQDDLSGLTAHEMQVKGIDIIEKVI